MPHWSDRYVGRRYVPDAYDCAHLACEVLANEFRLDVDLPAERAPGLRGLSRQIDALRDDLADRVDDPREGDGVLMVGAGDLYHIGIYCLIGGVPYVLHNTRASRQVVRHKLRELVDIGLRIEGFYRWK